MKLDKTKKFKLLIVDDIDMNIKLLQEMLKKELVYEIVIASTGREAVLTAKKNKPDLILLDVVLPDISGFEVCRELRDCPETQEIPIIFITASKLETDDVIEGFSSGGSDYVRKPFNKQELLARIQLHLKLKKAYDDLKLQAQDLQVSENRYRTVVEDQSEIICRFGPDGELSFVNQSCIRYFGENQCKLGATRFFDLIPDKDRLRIKEAIRSISLENQIITQELLYDQSDQNRLFFCLQWRIRGIWDDTHSEPFEYQAIGQDVTQRLEAEEAYRTFVDHSLYGMAIFQHGKFVYVNPMMTSITGYSATELLQMTSESLRQCIILPYPEQLDDLCQLSSSARICPVKQDNRNLNLHPHETLFQIQITKKDGTTGWLEISAVQTFYRRNPCVRIMCRDITRVTELEAILGKRDSFHDIIGRSPLMQRVYTLIEHFAPTDQTVLITGETGTGKEKIVDVIHLLSNRANNPLIRVNCAALSKDIIESELFGHVKGAFTGAHADKLGRFQAAEKGTLFLDEISELSLNLQAKLLRVIENKTYEPVGSSKSILADVRILAAANTDLKVMVSKGLFRKDLYYRLKVLTISLPPLRDRKEDIPLLVQYFLDYFRQSQHKAISGISPEVMKAFHRYSWNGNVRELKNTLEYAFSLCNDACIQLSHLPPDFHSANKKHHPEPLQDSHSDSYEQDHIMNALIVNKWHISNTAKSIGISRATLYRKMKEFGITKKN